MTLGIDWIPQISLLMKQRSQEYMKSAGNLEIRSLPVERSMADAEYKSSSTSGFLVAGS
jgi:hypothetical protein